MERYGLLGEKLGHSLSPWIHQKIFDYLQKENKSYCLLEVKEDKLAYISQGLDFFSFKGVNVTVPYKEKVLPYVAHLSQGAREAGAVNTLFNQNGRLYGYNTDIIGFIGLLNYYNIEIENQRAVILGTGGAAKAAGVALQQLRAKEICFVSRRPAQQSPIFSKWPVIGYDALMKKKGSLLVNATPVGMWPNTQNSPVDEKTIANFSTLVDMVYNPAETLFLRYGIKGGIKAYNGLYMLVAQAVAAQEIWQQTPIDPSVTEDIYKQLQHERSDKL